MLPLTDVYWVIRERMVKRVSHPAPERVPMAFYTVDKGQRSMRSPACITWIETGVPWITQWEPQGAGSLHDRLRSGRLPKLTAEAQALALAYISLKEQSRALTQVMRIAKKKATYLCTSALRPETLANKACL